MLGRGVFEVKARKGLIRVEAVVREGRVESVSIRGDFFLYPEDSLWMVEEKLRGVGVEEAPRRLEQLIGELGVRLVGAEPRDFAEALRGALRRAEEG